ncbi:hypothetical protein DNU06_02615 [Putridiphycobacter roseus]|uniref:UspA domain-containing protein n=1 Tax=Putridiphycobacter roseus TaxID=2219161 RepID=A0A2W1N563_9FLAO|nr:universal stress protein [Putridiphycobacter roseus]PZE18740.1 hypothetical protein DNU06_02615 [Putridiphycobacter roseus]
MNILLTTDFSYGAEKAIHYIINSFGTEGKEYKLLNAQNIKRAGATFDDSFFEEMIAYNQKELLILQSKLIEKYKGLKMDCIAETGNLVTVIEHELKLKNYELIGIGANGSANLYEKLIGTSARAVLKYSNIPVLVVPVVTKLRSPINVLIAMDKNYAQIKEQLIGLLSELKNKALNITLFHIDDTVDIQESDFLILREALLQINEHIKVNTKTKKSSKASIDNQILEFAENYEMDMIITSPNNHSFFEKLFTQSITNMLLDRTHIPLIALKK